MSGHCSHARAALALLPGLLLAALSLGQLPGGSAIPGPSFPAPDAGPWGPLGTVSGTFQVRGPGVLRPEKVILRPLLALVPPPGPPAPREVASCPVDETGAWRCELPAAIYDLSIGAPGLLPVVREGVEVRPGGTLDLGPIELPPSQSVSGWLTVEAGAIQPETCLFRVLPSAEGGRRQKVYPGDPRLLQRSLDRDGLFSIEPVEAGTRALRISCPGFVPLHVDDVKIAPGRDNRLRKPLLLRQPLEVAVEIQPPLDPEGKRWTVLLDRQSLGPAFRARPVGRHTGLADLWGRFRVPRLAPGLARVQVVESRGVRRALREVRIESHLDTPVRIELRAIHVRGTVTFAGVPVGARLDFEDEVSTGVYPMRTDRWGSFEGELPRGGRWVVRIAAPALTRARLLVRVKVEPDEAGLAKVEIEIPAQKVRGRVYDVDGRPAPKAVVALFGIEDQRSVVSDDRGRFELRFVASGPWALAARRPASPDWPAGISPRVDLEVSEGRHPAPVELRLDDLRKVAGLVTAAGSPLGGVEVQGRLEGAFPFRTRSGKDGSFQFEVPAGEVHETLLLRPPGGALQAFEVPVREGALLFELDEERTGQGTLVLDLPRPWGEVREEGKRIDLYVDGHRLLFEDLERWTEKRGHLLSPAAPDLRIPRLAPGEVRVCVGPAGPLGRIDPAAYRAGQVDCDEGRLDPGEELRLKPLL